MATMKQRFLIILLAGISTCVTSDRCPGKVALPYCDCEDRSNILYLDCNPGKSGKTIVDIRDMMLKSNMDAVPNIQLSLERFTTPHKFSSRIFEGFDIRRLYIAASNVTQWADEEGGPPFIGLEDNLEELLIQSSIEVPKKSSVEEHRYDKAPITLGHLRKLRELVIMNEIYNFGNDWFGGAGNTVDFVRLVRSPMYFFGDRAFASFTNLRYFELLDIPVKRITRDMFPNPANHLDAIVFTEVDLDFLPPDMFTNMPVLTRVSFHRSHITHIPEYLYRPIWPQLQYADFDGNDLVCDDHINWMFEVKTPQYVIGICRYPEHLRFTSLRSLIDNNHKEN